MSAAVKAAILADIATLTRVVDPAVEPFGFGSDLSCALDLDESMSELDPLTPLGIAQGIVRRADCPRGDLPDDANYGLGLRDWCNKGVDAADVRALAGTARLEFRKDDRILDCTVTVAPTPAGSAIAMRVAVAPKDETIGGFHLVLSITPVAVLLAELGGQVLTEGA